MINRTDAWLLTLQAQLGKTTQPDTPPFGRMRFEDGGMGTGMMETLNDSTGFFVAPSSDSFRPFDLSVENPDGDIPADQLVAMYSGEVLSTASIGITSDDLTQGSKRERDQGVIMGGLSETERSLSATKIAHAIGEQEGIALDGAWEWLHLVAFSIGPNRVFDLSDCSASWLETHEQTAQISENLILGTKEANSAMLTFETVVKNLLKKYDCELNLVVTCAAQKIYVDKYSANILAANELNFEFMFAFRQDGDDTVQFTPPASIRFSLLRHEKPSFAEFAKFYQACETHFGRRIEIKQENEPRIGGFMEEIPHN